MEMLNNSVTAGVILNAVSLSILAEMLSCPLAFVVSSVESRLYTSSSVQRKSVGQLSGEVCGRSLSVSPGKERLKFFTKEALRRFAFSRLEVAMMSPFLSVGIALLAIEGFHHFPKFFLIAGMQVPKYLRFACLRFATTLFRSFLNMRRSSLLPLRWAFLKYRFLFLIS